MPQIEEKREAGDDRVDWIMATPILTSKLSPELCLWKSSRILKGLVWFCYMSIVTEKTGSWDWLKPIKMVANTFASEVRHSSHSEHKMGRIRIELSSCVTTHILALPCPIPSPRPCLCINMVTHSKMDVNSWFQLLEVCSFSMLFNPCEILLQRLQMVLVYVSLLHPCVPWLSEIQNSVAVSTLVPCSTEI